MHGERLIGLDAIDWGYARKPLKDLGIDVTMSEFLIRSKWVPRTEAMTFFDDAMNALVGVFADDKAEAERNLSKWNQALKVVEARDAAARLMLPNVFLSGLDRARTLDAGIRVLREATATMCAIEIHRSEHGDLPETLGDLVPKHLKSLPVDWHTAERKSLIYRRTPGEGVGYVLYSVGYDGKDDGGKDEPGVSRVGKEDGTDCVFTVPSLEGSGEAAK